MDQSQIPGNGVDQAKLASLLEQFESIKREAPAADPQQNGIPASIAQRIHDQESQTSQVMDALIEGEIVQQANPHQQSGNATSQPTQSPAPQPVANQSNLPLDPNAPRPVTPLAVNLEQFKSPGSQSASAQAKTPPPAPKAESQPAREAFFPKEPQTLHEARLTDAEVEALVMKYLLAKGAASGRDIADQVKLPFRLIEGIIRQLKNEQLIGFTGSAHAGDHICRLSDVGRERAKRYSQQSTYFGAAPVDLRDYVASVAAQSIENQHPKRPDLERAFSDLLLNQRMFAKLGPAVNSGRGLFLFGFPGNGKTSIAERITRAFGRHIWIPRAIGIDGEVIRLFDPVNHVEAPLPEQSGYFNDRQIDTRWVRIERPTIVVGGELQMAHLEVSFNPNTGISEAPVQMKSNCGTLVIDDFGRQRMGVDELLNRWIVPLEMRYDFLNTLSGKKIQVPFDQLIVFSTNLEPRDLVDDAFLRRIPYKIEVQNPSETEFRQLFAIMCKKVGFELVPDVLDYLVHEHYLKNDRPFRNCHPRDLLQQIKNQCLFEDTPMKLTKDSIDFAVDNYFSVV